MKKTILLLTLSVFVFWACSENTNITSPEKSKTEQLLKFKSDSNSSLFKTAIIQSINGETGGAIEINIESPDGEFAVVGEIVFPENSFVGTKEISISVAGNLAALDFEPSLVFQTPVSLNLLLRGVDVSDNDNASFQYIENNGNLSSIEYSSVSSSSTEGEVVVEEAQLNHFSRYGFTR